ncbi:ABC transporter ATP-binding protein [Desulfurivibrio sp. D14AmB]|uniref:ABC transporter ATP-binding protein n=1 Tax=Desulfurivibrio sp. D14AmB TaxID=3374370 RepID=UPI00376F0B24
MTDQKLLDIHDLELDFKTDEGWSRVLEGVNLTVKPGETVALVGESGSGKTVTALAILQLLERSATRMAGRVEFEGLNLPELPERALRRVRGNRIAMIFQEPMSSLNPVYTIGDQLVEPLMIHRRMNRANARDFAVDLLERTGIPNPASRVDSFPHQLSGGQRQRVMIAMALACQPALLIADEPTTALDVTIQAQILQLILDIQREMEMAVLLITHDLNMVKKCAERIYIMHRGRVVEEGQTRTIFSNPQDPYTIHLLNSVPKGEAVARTSGPPLLTVRNLRCHFPVKKGFFRRTVGLVKAVDNVTLTIREGSTFGLVGESGSGKTTLGMCLLRLEQSKGSIEYRGRELLNLNNRRLRPLRRELQVVFQDPFASLSPRLNVAQIIGEGLAAHKIGGNRAQRLAMVQEVLREVGLPPEAADRYPHEFSGGQRQRIAIARAVVLNPRLLILDEPTSALDMTIQAQIIELLKKLQQRHNMTYIFISHDLRTIRALADEVAVMQNGRVVEAGPSHKLFSDPKHPYTRALFAAAFLDPESAANDPPGGPQ